MSLGFKHPEFLYFLFLVAIPIIVHLFSFRKFKKVFFHNIYLLKSLQNEQNKTHNKLKRILILCTRILIIIFTVFTFAQPYLLSDSDSLLQSQKNKTIVIYIDNSFSSQDEAKEGSIIEIAKKKAQLIVESFQESQTFRLLTNDINAREYNDLSKQEILTEISSIAPQYAALPLSQISQKVMAIQEEIEKPIQLFVLSDFQAYTSDLKQLEKCNKITYSLIPIEHQEVQNISIDSCWFSSPYRMHNQQEKLNVTVLNNSENTYKEIPVKLFINNKLKAISTISMDAHSKQTIAIDFTSSELGFMQCKVEIEDFPILYDNTYYFSYTIDKQIPILCISEKAVNTYISALFTKNKYFQFTTQQSSAIDYAQLGNYSFIILDRLSSIPSGLIQSINQLTKQGKTILFIPNKTGNINEYNALLAEFGKQRFSDFDTTKVLANTVDYKHPLYASVFDKSLESIKFPYVKGSFNLAPTSANSIISLQNKKPLLVETKKLYGRLFVFTAPLELTFTNFVSSPFIVGLYNMALQVTNIQPIATNLGDATFIPSSKNLTDKPLHIQDLSKNIDIIPEVSRDYMNHRIKLQQHQQLQLAGNYLVTQESKPISILSYNYNRLESSSPFYSIAEIESQIEENNIPNTTVITAHNDLLQEVISDKVLGFQLWRIMLLLAILFVFTEMFLIQYFNKQITHVTKN